MSTEKEIEKKIEKKAEKREAGMLSRGYEWLGEKAGEHRGIATAGAVVAGVAAEKYVISPGIKKLVSMASKKKAAEVTGQAAKNAIGGTLGAIGKGLRLR